MTEVIDARFRSGGKAYSFNPGGLTIRPGQELILSTTKGPEFGVCTEGNHMVDETTLTAPLRQVIRLATEEDRRQHETNRAKERQALALCRKKVAEHGLEMSLVSAEISPDGGKILFYFTAENRVDFRALVRDLAAAFHARIELRQIGVRDETKLLGGIGICGQPYCCSRFLDKFQPVSIKMAKTQNLSLNPTKISGACGRLMCCLKYEQEAYEDAVRRCPKRESFVETPDGVGTVVDVNYLRENVKVRIEDGGEQPRQYLNQEIRVVRSGKGKRPEDYVPPSKAELEALRYVPPKEERRLEDEPRSELAEKLEELFANEAKRTPTRKPSRAGGGGRTHRAQPQQRRTQNQGGKSRGGGDHHRRRRPPQGPKEG